MMFITGHRIFLIVVGLALALAVAPPARAGADEAVPSDQVDAAPGVSVTIAEPRATRRTFDPQDPPAEMPPLDGDEDAVCLFEVNVEVALVYRRPEGSRVREGLHHVEVTIESANVSASLDNTIWLPTTANAKLRAHEEGHRVINERIYERADSVARQLGDAALARTWTGSGVTAAEAIDDALGHATASVVDGFHEQITTVAQHVNDAYDDLTDHGRLPMGEAEAIDRAFAEVEGAVGLNK